VYLIKNYSAYVGMDWTRHNDRWGRTAQTKEVDLRRALRGRAGGSEEGPVWADYYLAVLAVRLVRQGGGVGAFQGCVGNSPVPGVKRNNSTPSSLYNGRPF